MLNPKIGVQLQQSITTTPLSDEMYSLKQVTTVDEDDDATSIYSIFVYSKHTEMSTSVWKLEILWYGNL